MRTSATALGLGMGTLLVALSLPAGEGDGKAPRPELKLAKGQTMAFKVQRTSESAGSGQQGEFKGSLATQLEYRVEVAERKENGDLVLKVSYAAIVAKGDGMGEPWEFDSSAKAESSEEPESARALLRKALAAPITVTVSGGRIADVSGLVQPQRPAEGEGGGRQRLGGAFRAREVVGRLALERDLGLALALPVQGKDLEKGKAYRREEPPSSGETSRGGRGRFFRDAGAGVVFGFDGEEKSDAGAVLKFRLSFEPPRPPRREGEERPQRGERKVEGSGTASVSLVDGALLRLEARVEETSSSPGDAPGFRFERKSKFTVERVSAASPKKAAVKL